MRSALSEIADVMDHRGLAARKLFTVLRGQHLPFELHSGSHQEALEDLELELGAAVQ
jgi:hypothetical protein